MSARRPQGFFRWRAAYLFAASAVYMADQATKAWAVQRLKTGEVVGVIGGLVHLSYAENPGIAFGRLQEGGQFGRWMLSGLRCEAIEARLSIWLREISVRT